MFIDTLSVTIELAELDFPLDALRPEAALKHLNDWLFYLGVKAVATPKIGRKNGFLCSLDLDAGAGHIAFGGNNKVHTDAGVSERPERLQLYLSGSGCRLVSSWDQLHDRLCDYLSLRITRIDLALDCFDGQINVHQCKDDFMAGAFSPPTGRPPKGRFIDDLGSGHGSTLYVGSRASGKLLRIYEKGKQLKDLSSPWVRAEVEILHKDRAIPASILTDPASFFAGAVPYLADLADSAEVSVIPTARKERQSTIAKMIFYCQHQYGKLMTYLLSKGIEYVDLIHMLSRAGTPKQLRC